MGFVYFHRNGDDRMINFDAGLFEFPEALYFEDSVGADKTAIRTFSGNETFAANQGLHVVKANPNQGNDVWSHLVDFTAWSVVTGAHLEYTSHYILENFDLIGKEATPISSPKTGLSFGPNVTEMVIIDPEIENFETGINLQKSLIGFSVDNHGYVVINPSFVDVAQTYDNYDPSFDRILDGIESGAEPPGLAIDGPMVFTWGSDWSNSGVFITGTKTDTLGTVDFPGGTDRFWIEREDMVELMETTGYWRTSDGQAYTLLNIHFTDRATGTVYVETHPVFVDANVNSSLGNPNQAFANAIDNGTQDIVDGMAGTTQLYTPSIAIPNTTALFDQNHPIWEMIANGQGVFSTDARWNDAPHARDSN
jgi:hypothetical protein